MLTAVEVLSVVVVTAVLSEELPEELLLHAASELMVNAAQVIAMIAFVFTFRALILRSPFGRALPLQTFV